MQINSNYAIHAGIDMFDKEVDIDGERIKMYIW